MWHRLLLGAGLGVKEVHSLAPWVSQIWGVLGRSGYHCHWGLWERLGKDTKCDTKKKIIWGAGKRILTYEAA